MYEKLVFFGEVHHIDRNVVLLRKLWDFTDRYRTLNTIQVDLANIELSVNSLRVGFEENWVCGHTKTLHMKHLLSLL